MADIPRWLVDLLRDTPATGPLEQAFATATWARNRAYDNGLLRAHEVQGLSIVSVGGITTGGDGKTPMAMHVARAASDLGVATALVSRGYGGRWERRGGVVSDGTKIVATVEQGGDEALLCARRLPGISVVVGADRVAAARMARALGARFAVLDSGFQHRRLCRDLDVVIAPLPEDGAKLLPRGPLREPLSSLGRADVVAYEAARPPLSAESPAVSFQKVGTALVDRDLARVHDVTALAGHRVMLVSGIARPKGFERTVKELRATIAAHMKFPDHHPFRGRDRHRIASRASHLGVSLVVTTEKDLLRLGIIDGPEVLALRVEVEMTAGRAELESMIWEVAG